MSMYTDNRDAYRQLFFDVWAKYQKQLPMQPVEQQVLEVIIAHPEYHALLSSPQQFMTQEFEIEENPFFHMSLHIAIREQLTLDRPTGIKQIHQTLLTKLPSPHDTEHYMATVLARIMHAAQQTGHPPDEQQYLNELKRGATS